MKQIILASQSPRRQELFKIFDLPFEIVEADIDETMDLSLPPHEEVMRLAYQKAQKVLTQNPDALVIGADTIVCNGDKILGKPENYEDAMQMLTGLSGTTHHVITAVSVQSAQIDQTFYDVNDIVMYELSSHEIEEYLATDEPWDKAGAYAIQGIGRLFIKEIRGDFHSIMGLPCAKLHRILKGVL